MLSVTYKPFMLSAIMLNFVMLIVVMPIVLGQLGLLDCYVYQQL